MKGYYLIRSDRNLDEILEMLEKTTKRTQKIFDESKFFASKKIQTYEKILKSKESSNVQRIKATLGRMLEYDRLERLSSQLSLLYLLQIFVLYCLEMQIFLLLGLIGSYF